MSAPEIRVLPDIAAIAHAAADEFVRLAPRTVALAGGSTPRALYELLATRQDIAWDAIQFFWGDERHVPPDDHDSNYRMTREALLDRVPAPESNIHRIRAENPNAAVAAMEYESELHSVFGDGVPRFDLVLMGMGPEGHTASLFPGSEALRENHALVVAPWVDKMHSYRITMTLPVFNNASNVMFMVAGMEKAQTLKLVLEESQEDSLPAAMIRPANGRLMWMIDREAGRLLRSTL